MTLRQKILCISMIALTFIALVGTVIAAGLSTQYDITVGGVCPEDIYATRTITDIVTTNERKNAAALRIEDVYITDFDAIDRSVERVKEALADIRSLREAPVEAATDIDPAAVDNTTYLSDRAFSAALEISAAQFDLLSTNVPLILRDIMTDGVTDKEAGIESFNEAFVASGSISDRTANVAYELCKGAISVNKAYSAEETDKQREAAKDAVSNVTYMKNQAIARRGEIITDAQYAMLKELGFVKGSIQLDVFHTVSVVSLLLLTIGLVILYYVTMGKRDITTTPSLASVICAILTIAGSLIILFGVKSGGEGVIYLMPLSLIPALISLLLGSNLACMVNIVTAALAGIQTNDLSVTLSLILAGAATAYVFSRVRRRTHLLSATALSATAYALSYGSIMIDTSKNILDVFLIFAYAFAGGFFGGILTIGTIPFWEAMFDVITPMKLGELSNPEHKLLKKLLLNAPGSYHHSLTVANMADAAAEAIGANALLARVGAYYHDIGKMENPMYFKENQFGTDNPHDSLPYEESADILLKHVSDGVRLAAQYHLPTAVKDIIAQHHGTTTTGYFLYKARSENPDVDPARFTYPGPTPQSKEATIIMLADACEAAVRAMREKGAVDAKKVVDDIVSTRLSEGQLAGTSLTFSDLEKVKASFVKTLDQYFHKRIIYPQNEKKD